MKRVEKFNKSEAKRVKNELKTNREFDLDDLFFRAVCKTAKDFMSSKYLEFLDMVCDTKEAADWFFRMYPSQAKYENDTYLISDWIYEQPDPYRTERADNWHQIVEKINEICNKYYGVKWGKQKIKDDVFDVTNISKPDPLVPFDKEVMSETKYIAKYAKNRPVYVGDQLIGYCKDASGSSLADGYQRRFDDEDYIYYTVDTYTSTFHFKFYETTNEIVNRIKDLKKLYLHGVKFNKHDGQGFPGRCDTYIDGKKFNSKRMLFYAGSGHSTRNDGLHISPNNIMKNITFEDDKIVVNL